jgi:hypothetical protein
MKTLIFTFRCLVLSQTTKRLIDKYLDCLLDALFVSFICLQWSILIMWWQFKKTFMLIGMLRPLRLVIIQLNMILTMKLISGGKINTLMKVIQWVKLLSLKFTIKKFLSKGLMPWKIRDMIQKMKETTKKNVLKLHLLIIILKL